MANNEELKVLYEGITPEAIKKYLLSHGWWEWGWEFSRIGNYVLFKRIEGNCTIKVPGSTKAKDYYGNLLKLIHKISLKIGESEGKILKDMKMNGCE